MLKDGMHVHTHVPYPAKVEARKIVIRIKEQAMMRPSERASELIDDEIERVWNDEVRHLLPARPCLVVAVNRRRKMATLRRAIGPV